MRTKVESWMHQLLHIPLIPAAIISKHHVKEENRGKVSGNFQVMIVRTKKKDPLRLHTVDYVQTLSAVLLRC